MVTGVGRRRLIITVLPADTKSQTNSVVGLAEAIRDGCIQLGITIGGCRDKNQVVLKLRGYSAPA